MQFVSSISIAIEDISVSVRNSTGVLSMALLATGYTGVRNGVVGVLRANCPGNSMLGAIVNGRTRGIDTMDHLLQAAGDANNPYSRFVGFRLNAMADAMLAAENRRTPAAYWKVQTTINDLEYVYRRFLVEANQ
jgi:hypothetical protein